MKHDILSREEVLAFGYDAARQLPDQTWLAVQRLLYTVSLIIDVDRTGYECRYCYPSLIPALIALETWDGHGDPPGPWVKQKGRGVDRLNPRLADEDFED